MDSEDGRLRWGTEQRLEFIEFRAFWEGGVRRGDITNQFGVSVPQASNDLALYQKLAPANLRYDSSEKRYVPTNEFAARFMKPSADRYLMQLQSLAERIIKLDDTWITEQLSIGVLPVPERRVSPHILKQLVAIIRSRESIEVLFQSMNLKRPDSIWRRITPHAFAHDGLRWHVRAFCHIDNKFKDFILSRCQALRAKGLAGAAPSDDVQWGSYFDVILEPNPMLTETQRHAIAIDYDMKNGWVSLPVRRALLYYFEKRLRFDLTEKDTPAEKPVIIANWDEFVEARNIAAK